MRKSDVELAETLHKGAAISWEGKLVRRAFEQADKEQAVFETAIAGSDAKLEALPLEFRTGAPFITYGVLAQLRLTNVEKPSPPEKVG